MIKKIFLINISLGLALLILGVSIFKASAQTGSARVTPTSGVTVKSGAADLNLEIEEATLASIPAPNKKVATDYYLPYPGILPDHPLYFLKMIRDRIWLILTTNPLKKAEVLLLFADKRIGAANVLVTGNKVSLGLSTATKAEKYLEKAIAQEEKARQAGQDTKLFLEKLSQAITKHEEILLEMKEKVGDETEPIEQILSYPRQGASEVQKRLSQ